jgi:hypothetical protein
MFENWFHKFFFFPQKFEGIIFREFSNAGLMLEETSSRSRRMLCKGFIVKKLMSEILVMEYAHRVFENDEDSIEGWLQSDVCELGFSAHHRQPL